MKEYLFLYPVENYIDFYLNAADKACYLNKVIDARYRKNGYMVNWLLFSSEDNLLKPDLSMLSRWIRVQDNDRILAAGISFKKHIKEKVYPNLSYVLSQIPSSERLVIGGFHQRDCVDKIACGAYKMGIDVFVDEDTTNLFFARVDPEKEVPLVREKWLLSELCLGLRKPCLEMAKLNRKNKPWLTQA